MSPHVLFRRLAVAEGVTWALLLAGMFVKYVPGWTDLGVRVFGLVHGVVFLGYCVGAVFVAVDRRWGAGRTLLALAAAVPPFATVWFERAAARRGWLVGDWRLTPHGEDPVTRSEQVQAWMLRRPVLALVAGAALVGVLTGAALAAGPPVPPGS